MPDMLKQINRMKRWAVLTVLLYALALMALTVPVLLVAFGGWAKSGIGLQNALRTYLNWGYWLWLAVLLAGQDCLLLLPINISERRFPARRSLKTPITVGAFSSANLAFAGILSILFAAFADKTGDYLDLSYPAGKSPSGLVLLQFSPWLFFSGWSGQSFSAHFAGSDDPDSLLKRTTRWLLCGSILELLVAVPSHIIVRRREDCCAPAGTFWGIATGISIMLLCFGPGVFFLFVERFKRLQPKPQSDNKN